MIRGNHDATIAALIEAIGNMQMEKNDQLRQANEEQMKTIQKYWEKEEG